MKCYLGGITVVKEKNKTNTNISWKTSRQFDHKQDLCDIPLSRKLKQYQKYALFGQNAYRTK